MTKQRTILGLFSGAVLFFALLSLYPIQTHAPIAKQDLPITTSTDGQKDQEKEITFSVLDQGEKAPGAKNRKNYAIYNQEELNSFWKLSHEGTDAKAPTIDFNKKYVVVVFAGTKPTTGYKIKVTKVEDAQGQRNIAVAMIEPGEGCTTKTEKTSPYQFIALPYDTETSLSHNDTAKTEDCK